MIGKEQIMEMIEELNNAIKEGDMDYGVELIKEIDYVVFGSRDE